ncbi:hypothetical protein [Streptomyces avicenniae]|uniref:hypothetical protein n=1 Tax=Streptomyces avicenniae TaxID=500153 RepID=UPI00167D251B|nr:hypothetical protein [Streptomyces avicenniae]
MGNAALPGTLALPTGPHERSVDDEDVRTLLGWLENRGDAWRRAGPDGFEGIHGWLDPDESWLLAEALDGRPPPLAVLRDLARRAAADGRGVLWGLDL